MNEIYKNNQDVHSLTNDLLATTTNIRVQYATKISDKAYDQSVRGLQINYNRGGGNCFFIAVADAINSYNYNNQTNRIISGRYGTGINLYTQLYLRNLVYNFLQNWSGLDNQFDYSQIYVDDLNDKDPSDF